MSFAEARRALKAHWGYPRFRPGQAEVVKAVLAGKDAVVLLPTGSGKSLCYQVPAAVARKAGRGCTLVVSPLIALIQDQVGSLRGRGLNAGAVHSHMSADERKAQLAALREGAFDLFYFSPERAAMPDFRYAISTTPVALLAIDEAHCLSQWGHDFRPDYMRLDELRSLIDAPILALTATATPRVMDEISERLQLREPTIVRGDFARPNLAFAVEHIDDDAARLDRAIEILEGEGLRGREGRGGGGRAIVYCATRKHTERVAKALEGAGFAVGWYHAGRSESARDRAQRAFELRRTRILVATNAFGMGVDLPDVRAIVHMQSPGSLEAYYQESGRAGRDGQPANCTLFFGAADVATQRTLMGGAHAGAEATRPREDALATIERYAHELRCRQIALCAHFSGHEDHPPCGRCDVCVDPEAVEAAAAHNPEPEPLIELDEAELEIIVSAVDRLGRPFAAQALADALHGGRAKHLSKGALLGIPEYGQLAHSPVESIREGIETLIAAERLHGSGFGAKRRVSIGAAPRRTFERPSRAEGALRRDLEYFRSRTAKRERVGVARVFALRVVTALVRRRPQSIDELHEIAGLDHARIEKYGEALLEILTKHD